MTKSMLLLTKDVGVWLELQGDGLVTNNPLPHTPVLL